MANNRSYVVYKHTSPDGKVYIGITSMRVEERWGKGRGYRKNAHFMRAIEKYGWDSFEHEVLYWGLTKDQAEAKEIELIEAYNSTDKKYGYNLMTGGGVNGTHNSETRLAMSNAKIEYWKTHDCTGEANGMWGKHRTEAEKEHLRNKVKERCSDPEYIKKLSDSHKGKMPVNAKRVECVELGFIFESAQKAADFIGTSRSGISLVCESKQKTAGGYHWKFCEQ